MIDGQWAGQTPLSLSTCVLPSAHPLDAHLASVGHGTLTNHSLPFSRFGSQIQFFAMRLNYLSLSLRPKKRYLPRDCALQR